MHAIFNEDFEEEDDEEQEVVEEPTKEEEITPVPEVVEQPVVQEEVKPQPVFTQAASSVEENPENFMDSPIFEKAIIQPKPKKSTIFKGLDVDSIAQEETKPKQKVYKYDRHKSVKVRRVAEDLDYQPVISPIFGNVEDDKKEFDKVHDAISLQKPEDEDFSQILSPMYGTYLPSMQPAKSIPEYKVEDKKANMNLSEMLEKPNLRPLPDKPFEFGRSNVIDRKIKQKTGRNDPCPCGSGKKYKKCCMDKDE